MWREDERERQNEEAMVYFCTINERMRENNVNNDT